jgi:hypothetical protein
MAAPDPGLSSLIAQGKDGTRVFTVSSVLGPAEGERCHARPRLFPLPFALVLQKFPTGFEGTSRGRR